MFAACWAEDEGVMAGWERVVAGVREDGLQLGVSVFTRIELMVMGIKASES